LKHLTFCSGKSGINLTVVDIKIFRKREFMKRKVPLFLAIILAFAWSAAVADTRPVLSAGDVVSGAEIEKAEQEKLLLQQDQKDEIYQEEEKVFIDEKAQAQLEAERLEAEAVAQKLAKQEREAALEQAMRDKARMDELMDKEQRQGELTEEEAMELKSLYSEFYPETPAGRPSGGTILVEGDDCDDPIVVDLDVVGLPYSDVGQTTCGRLDDYDATCLDYYDGGEDIIYEIIVTTPGDYEFTMDPLGTTWTGMLIDDTCPPGGIGECIEYDTGSSGTRSFVVSLAAGTYYVMVDTWSSPDCIPEFNLTIDSYEFPTGRCCYNYFADCTDGISEADCLLLPGSPMWDEGLNCTDNPCPISPQGDNCTDPFIIPESFPFSEIGNTCDFNNFCDITGTDNSDVIYQLDITSTIDLEVSLCNSAFDTKLAIFQGDCCTGSDTEWQYNDDNSDHCSPSNRSYIMANFTPGTYFIVVDGFGSNCGDYQLDITEYFPPVGRCCYDDPVQCADNTEAECDALAGSWTEGLNCVDDPCPGSEGNDCDNPIVVDLDAVGLPYNDNGQTTCGRVDDYEDTCLGSYDGGEDIIYEIVVGTTDHYEITMDPLGTTWTGILIDDTCPAGGSGECIDYVTGSSGSTPKVMQVYLEAGTYYIMVDTYPQPDCIPAFNLTIDTYVPPVGRR
jgi:hypothetical protein